MIPIFTRLLAIISEASNVLGSSNKLTILFQELSCLVFKILMSLSVKEKKAIFDPETMKEMIKKNKMRIANMVVACTLMINKKRDR